MPMQIIRLMPGGPEISGQGIGLVRTEHMFMEGGRLAAMQEMILAEDEEEEGLLWLRYFLPERASQY